MVWRIKSGISHTLGNNSTAERRIKPVTVVTLVVIITTISPAVSFNILHKPAGADLLSDSLVGLCLFAIINNVRMAILGLLLFVKTQFYSSHGWP